MTALDAIVVLTLTSAVVTWLAMPLLYGLSSRAGWLAENYLGRKIPSSGGLMLLPGLSLAWLAYLIIGAPQAEPAASRLIQPAIILVWGFALLGFLDDRGGVAEHGGFRYHFSTLLQGRLTTGGAKAIGGGILALLASLSGENNLGVALLNAVLIALCANLINLFDVRPGRAVKAFGLLTMPVAAAAIFRVDLAILLFPVLGGVAIVGASDLKGNLMLGDTGANLLGAVAGLGLAGLGSWPTTLGALLIVGGINLLTEKLSLNAQIQKSSLLSWFDKLGRRE
ncbi:MAG: hypothetical protein GX058_07115 [Firmicutes bacterium]|nr:hypothetical protein [Bacillota bacterium]